MKKILFFIVFSLIIFCSIELIFGFDDYFCFTKLKNNESVPSIVSSYSTNLICQNGKCTCLLTTGDGYCLVCTNSSGWFAAFNLCNSDYCDPNENITGPLDQFVKFPFLDNGIITKQRFFVTINTTRKSKIDLIDNVNFTRKNLCMHCNYFSKMLNFPEGFNNITIKSAVAGEVESETISFFIDTKKPRITKTFPRANSFSNGEFFVEYEETNLKEVSLYYGEKDNIFNKKLNCKSGKQNCSISLDLSAYSGKSIYYWFSLVDIANNTVNSSKTKIFVDNEKPIINSINYSLRGESYNMVLNISDDNFLKAVYIDSGKERLFCNSLKNEICSRNVNVKDFIIIKVYDRADNSEEKVFFFN